MKSNTGEARQRDNRTVPAWAKAAIMLFTISGLVPADSSEACVLSYRRPAMRPSSWSSGLLPTLRRGASWTEHGQADKRTPWRVTKHHAGSFGACILCKAAAGWCHACHIPLREVAVHQCLAFRWDRVPQAAELGCRSSCLCPVGGSRLCRSQHSVAGSSPDAWWLPVNAQARLRRSDITEGCSVMTGAPVGGAGAVIDAFAVLPSERMPSCSLESDMRCGAVLAPLLMLDVLLCVGSDAFVAGRTMKVVVLPRLRLPAFCLPVTCVNRSSSSEPRSASKAACRRRSALRDMLTRSGGQC